MSILEYFKMSNNELEHSDYKPIDKTIRVYTDGSCIHNGKPYAKAGIGVFFGVNDPRNVSERIEGKQSNNTAELKAIIKAIHILDTDISLGHKIIIYSDSEYSIKCATTYGRKMHNLNWKKPIPNRDLVKRLYKLYNKYTNVKLKHIRAHTGKQDKHSIGNDWADRLANGCMQVEPKQYTNIKLNKQKVKNNSKGDKGARIYLNVPYKEKDIVKKHGGKWDSETKKWYIMDSLGELDKYFIMEKWGK
tara:strand:+ start:8292 stop:9032 length:741 start_codon:yes stop_codon:yes gene_type:complete